MAQRCAGAWAGVILVAGAVMACSVTFGLPAVGYHSPARLHSLYAAEPVHHFTVVKADVQQLAMRAPSVVQLGDEAAVQAHAQGREAGGRSTTAALARDDDHGHVPAFMLREALKLAKEQGSSHAKAKIPENVMSAAAQKRLLVKAVKEQNADQKHAESFYPTSSQGQRASVVDSAAVDKDHGHVSMKFIRLAEKLALEQDQSMALHATQELSNTVGHGGESAPWTSALIKAERQEDRQSRSELENPLAMGVANLQSTKHTSSLAMSSRKSGATNHVRSASEAITQQAAAGMNLERPTAQDKAKQSPAENPKAAGAKQKVISQDHTQGREAHVGETEAMQTHVEKAMALNPDTEAIFHHNKKEALLQAGKFTTTAMHADTVDDFVQEAAAASADKAQDDEQIEKPLAHMMVKEGYVDNPEKEARKWAFFAQDHTQTPSKFVQEVAGLNGGEAMLHDANRVGHQLHGAKPDADSKAEKLISDEEAKENPAVDSGNKRALDTTDVDLSSAYVREVSRINHGAVESPKQQQLITHPSPLAKYIKEANAAAAQKKADDAKVETPLYDEMVKGRYIRDQHKYAMAGIDFTNRSKMPPIQAKATPEAAGQKPLQRLRQYSGGPHIQRQSMVKYLKEAAQAAAQKAADDEKVQKPLADMMVREHYIVDRDQMAKDSTDFSRVKMMGGPEKLDRYAPGDGSTHPSLTSKVDSEAKAGADLFKDAMARRNEEDAKKQGPLYDAMVAQGYVRANSVYKNSSGHLVHRNAVDEMATGRGPHIYHPPTFFHPVQPVHPARPRVRPAAKTVKSVRPMPYPSTELHRSPSEERREEAAHLLKIVDGRSTWHDPANNHWGHYGTETHAKQTVLLHQAMQTDQEVTKYRTMADKVKTTFERGQSLSMKDTVEAANQLIERAIKEQQEGRQGRADELHRDRMALAKREQLQAHVADENRADNLFKQAMSEQHADRVKSESELNGDILIAAARSGKEGSAKEGEVQKEAHAPVSADVPVTTTKQIAAAKEMSQLAVNAALAQDPLLQQTIKDQDTRLDQGLEEQEHEAFRGQRGDEKQGLLKLARQAMSEIDQDHEAYQADEIRDDEAAVAQEKEMSLKNVHADQINSDPLSVAKTATSHDSSQ